MKNKLETQKDAGETVDSSQSALDRIVQEQVPSQEDEIQPLVFQCGKSSITLNPDGTIVLKGERIISEAAEDNIMRGSKIFLN